MIEAIGTDVPAHVGLGATLHKTDFQIVGIFGCGLGPGSEGHVVVDAQEIDGRLDDVKVAWFHLGIATDRLLVISGHLGIAAEQHRVGEPAVYPMVDDVGSEAVFGTAAGWMHPSHVEGDTDLALAAHFAVGAHGQAMGKQQVMGHLEGDLGSLEARGMLAVLVAQLNDDGRFIMGDPTIDQIAELAETDPGIVFEIMDDAPFQPSALVLEGLGQVPVVQGDRRFDAGGMQGFQQAAIKGHTSLVDGTGALRQDARPGDGEAVGLESQLLHDFNIFLEVMIVIAGLMGGIAIGDLARLGAKTVPDGLALAIGLPSTLDLGGSGGRPPLKTGRELHFTHISSSRKDSVHHTDSY